MKKSNYLQEVRAQYENYPYPLRDPLDEKKRLKNTSADFLEKINHYCYSGEQNFENFRVLIVGGGTGDSTIFLAEQLRNKNAEIVYIDFSTASMKIAKERAKIRGLRNIIWLHESLLELPNLDLQKHGKFDYINCSGVLHHLQDPVKGLEALKAVLKDDGCMMLMLYAQYGRMGVYQIQDLMQMINTDENDMQTKVDNTKKILTELPSSNWFKKSEELIYDHTNYGDIGIYDLFLNSRDRAYTIPEVYDYLNHCNLNLIEFISPRGIKLILNPKLHISNPDLLAKVMKLDKIKRQGIVELMLGSIKKHTFYASNRRNTIATIDNISNVPYFFPKLEEFEQLQKLNEGEKKIIPLPDGNKINFIASKYSALIFKYLDGNRSIKEILNCVRKENKLTELKNKEILLDFKPIYQIFNDFDLLMLRNKKVPPFKPFHEIEQIKNEFYDKPLIPDFFRNNNIK